MAPAQEGSSLGGHLRALRSSAGAVPRGHGGRDASQRALSPSARGRRARRPSRARLRQGIHPAYCASSASPPTRRSPSTIRARGAACHAGVPARCARVRRGDGSATLWRSASALLLIFGGGLVVLKLVSQPTPARWRSPGRRSDAPESAPERWPPPAAPAASVPPPRLRPPSRQARGPRDAAARRQGRGADLDPRANRRRARGGGASRGRRQREWTSDRRFVLTIGNAGGIEVVLNGRPLPPLGARGAVIHRLSLPELPGQGS